MVSLRRVSLLCSTLGILALPATASADPTSACDGKKEGDACAVMHMTKSPEGSLQRENRPGVCTPDECCDLDYSKGSPPETVCHACLACKAGGPPVAAPTKDPAKESGGAPPPAETKSGADPGPPAPAPSEQRGCTVGGSAPSPHWGLWAPLLLLGLRRRWS